MKKFDYEELISRIEEDISIIATAYCPICDQEFDSDDSGDTYFVLLHIREDHTIEELRDYENDNKM